MKLLRASSYSGLLLRTLFTTWLLNLLFTPFFYVINLNYPFGSYERGSYHFVVELVISMLCVLWGLYMRKVNATLLSSSLPQRKSYAKRVFLVMIIVVAGEIDLVPDVLDFFCSLPNRLLSRTNNLAALTFFGKMYALPTIYSLMLTLGIVFFYKPSRWVRSSANMASKGQ